MLDGLLIGLESLLQPTHILILLLAMMIGFLGGALPGISGTMLVIILLPISYGMDTVSAFILLTTIYAASVFSGLISAILFRTPGTPEAIATVLDGYPMAQKGKPGQALGIGIFSSATGRSDWDVVAHLPHSTFGLICLEIFLSRIFCLSRSWADSGGISQQSQPVDGFYRGRLRIVYRNDRYGPVNGSRAFHVW